MRHAKRLCSARQTARRERHRIRRKHRRRSSALGFQRSLGNVIEHKARRGLKQYQITCPTELNLSTAYETTVGFLMGLRDFGDTHRGSGIYVDMRAIERVTPAGALLLAAELDRWASIRRTRLKARDVAEWSPSVRVLLEQMGFFHLLEAKPYRGGDGDPGTVTYLPFRSGSNADARPFLPFADGLEHLAGAIDVRPQLYQAVSEAFVNVRQHAYPKSSRTSGTRTATLDRWWLSGSYDSATREVTAMVLDHGHGIPTTLRKGKLREKFIDFIKTLTMEAIADDAYLIEAAVTLGRSATGEAHRGHGLTRDIISFVENYPGAARLRLFSNKGLLIYQKQPGEQMTVERVRHRQSIRGTFCEWRFTI